MVVVVKSGRGEQRIYIQKKGGEKALRSSTWNIYRSTCVSFGEATTGQVVEACEQDERNTLDSVGYETNKEIGAVGEEGEREVRVCDGSE